MRKAAKEVFKNKVRIRANGILQKEDHDSVLLVQLQSPVTDELVWMPPGGGLDFGENMADCLKREFREETGLQVGVDSLAFINEMIQPPFHAVEFYFRVHRAGDESQGRLGKDPELPDDDQLLNDLKWVSFDELRHLRVVPKQLKSWLGGSKGSESVNFYSDDNL